MTDYALDLKNFHETSHDRLIAPILIATAADSGFLDVQMTPQNDKLLMPMRVNAEMLGQALDTVLASAPDEGIDWHLWKTGRYSPTPTIMEAALALYRRHSVAEISRSDAGAINLGQTSDAISGIIQTSKALKRKSICFVTGVPGAGKTLVGLNISTKYMDIAETHHSVFLSGNGPLVKILQEALARDMVVRTKAKGGKIKKGEAKSRVKAFIQNVHHFRDECLIDEDRPPIDHVALFDEAQRAWNHAMTADFMKRKKKRPGFAFSEPEFLISCLDRHSDWAVIVCLVGGGQEINTGEAGISEWIDSLMRSYPDWHVHISPQLIDSEYGTGRVLKQLEAHRHVNHVPSLHLSVSMRSFRAENVSLLVKQILDLDREGARQTHECLREELPDRDHPGPRRGEEVAQKTGARYRALWHSRFFPGRAAQAACHLREIAHGPDPLVSRRKRRREVILLPRRRGHRIRCAGAGAGLGVCHVGRGFPLFPDGLDP